MNAFHFPHPGERQNASEAVVSDKLLVNLVVLASIAHWREGCHSRECFECANNLATIEAAQRLLPASLSEVVDRAIVSQIGMVGQKACQ